MPKEATQAATPANFPRTKTVKTETVETIPVNPNEVMGLGAPWQDYLAEVEEDELAITEVKVYRAEPKTQEGYLCKVVGERVDDSWIAQRYGGGVFNVRISSKSGKGGFERGVRIAGPPKLLPTEARVIGIAGTEERGDSPAAAAQTADVNGRLLGLVDGLMDRLERMQERMQTATAPPASATTAVQGSVVEMMTEAAKSAIALAGSGRPAGGSSGEEDEDKFLKRLTLYKNLFAPATAAAGSGGAGIEDEFTKAIKAAFLKRLTEEPKSESGSLADQLANVANLRELLGGDGKPENWTTALINRLPEAFDKLADIFQARVQQSENELERTRIAAAAAGRMRPPAMQPAGMPAAAEVVQTSANPPGAPPMRPAPAASSTIRMVPMGGGAAITEPIAPSETFVPFAGGGLSTESAEFQVFVKSAVVRMVKHGETGGGIVGFLNGCNQQAVVQMIMSYSTEQLTAFLKQDPILVEATEDANWQDVIEEARAYIRANAEETAEPEVGGKPEPVN